MSDLPRGWARAALRDVCLPVEKVEPNELGRSTFRYVDIGSVDGSRHALADVEAISVDAAPSRARQLVRTGDTVFSTVRPYLEKIAYIDSSLDGEIASTGFCVLRPGPDLLPRYLFHFAVSKGLLAQVLPFQKGVSYPAVLNREVLSAEIPMPPIEEQQRIVDTLEDHLSHLDAAAGLLGHCERSADSLSHLLVQKAVGQAGPVRPLRDLTVASGYGTSEKCVAGGPGVAVVRIPNLVSGVIDLSDEKRVQNPNANVTGLMLRPGDLLIVRTNGSRDLIGRAAVVRGELEAAFASYLIRFQLDQDQVRPEWVRTVLASASCRRELESLAASSAGQYNLSLSKLAGIPIPVPSLERQDQLLEELDQSLAVVARFREESDRVRQRAGTLRGAILAAAFNGALAPPSVPPPRIQEHARV